MNKFLPFGLNSDALCEEITGDDDDDDDEEEVLDETDLDEEAVPLDMSRVKRESTAPLDQPLNMCSKRTKQTNSKALTNGTANRSAANQSNSGINSTQSSHTSAESHGSHGFTERWNRNGKRVIHEEEEEDDDEDNDLQLGDRLLSEQSTGAYDPERLKAFNV